MKRRTVVAAAAWAAPAIAVSVASPATATSLGRIVLTEYPVGLLSGQASLVTGALDPGIAGTVMVSIFPSAALDFPAHVAAGPDGSFSFLLDSPGDRGVTPVTVVLSAPGYDPAQFTVLRVATAAGTIELVSTPGPIPQGEQDTATGRLMPPPTAALPSNVRVHSSATGVATVPAAVAVDADGTFGIPVTAVADGGTSTITVSAGEYSSTTFTVSAAAPRIP
jgi:hypothetical protein